MKRIIALLFFLFLAMFPKDSVLAQAAPGNFVIPSDVPHRYASYIRPAPSYVDARVLAAGVSETHTMPANTRFVIFSADCNFYAKPGASAAVPAADVTDGSASEQNPVAWYFTTPPTQITLVSATACKVTLSIYLGPVQ